MFINSFPFVPFDPSETNFLLQTACRGAERMCAIMDMVEGITDDTQHELDSTLGVLFIGFMLSIVLYGLSTFRA